METSNDLRHWEFELLYRVMNDRLKEKLKDLDAPPDVIETYIQNGSHPYKSADMEGYPNLVELINDDPKVKTYIKKRAPSSSAKNLELSPSVFSTKLEEIRTGGSPYQKIRLKQDTRHILFLFLGCKDLDDFKAKHLREISYKGKYFSHSKGRICSFKFKLRVAPVYPDAISLMVIEAVSIGFHEEGSDAELSGELLPANRSWIGTLRDYGAETRDEHTQFMQLSLYTRSNVSDPARLTGFDQLFGAVHTISNNGHLICVECVLLKDHLATNPQAQLEIDRYLHVRRNYFGLYVDDKDFGSLHSLKTAETYLSSIQHYSNRAYRIIAQNANGGYNQARFTIREDYTATIVVPKSRSGTEELECRISIDNVQASRLLVYSYQTNQRYRMHTATAIEFQHRFDSHHPVLRGSYCVVDSASDSQLSHNRFVMQVDEGPFEIKKWFSEEEQHWETDVVRDRLIAILREEE